MLSKGFNSILFDFDSLLDKELTLIQWMKKRYRDEELANFDKHKLLYTPIDKFKFMRVYGADDAFEQIITNDKFKDKHSEVLNIIMENNEKDILTEEFVYPTSMQNLLRAYKKAGDGVIKTAVRCDNEIQVDYIKQSIYSDIRIELCKRSEVDMSMYARLIVGNYKSALEYELKEPKSILVVNFRENFTMNDITILNPELVISLGDIHDIEAISAFQDQDKKPAEG